MLRAVLFDIDGVLLDSTAANAAFYAELFRRIGGTGPTATDMLTNNHLSMEAMLRRFYPDTPQEQIEVWKVLGDTIDVGFDLLQPMPGVMEVLPILAQRYQLGIVSNRTTASVEELWKIVPFQDKFSAIAAFEMTKHHKPDPEPVHYVLSKLHVQPTEAIFVGDAQTDLQAGMGAGVPVIILGLTPWTGAAATVDTFEKIPQAIENIAKSSV